MAIVPLLAYFVAHKTVAMFGKLPCSIFRGNCRRSNFSNALLLRLFTFNRRWLKRCWTRSRKESQCRPKRICQQKRRSESLEIHLENELWERHIGLIFFIVVFCRVGRTFKQSGFGPTLVDYGRSYGTSSQAFATMLITFKIDNRGKFETLESTNETKRLSSLLRCRSLSALITLASIGCKIDAAFGGRQSKRIWLKSRCSAFMWLGTLSKRRIFLRSVDNFAFHFCYHDSKIIAVIHAFPFRL